MNPEEIALAIQAFVELEPEVQKGIVALVHLIHRPKPVISGPIISRATTSDPPTPETPAS